MNHPANEGSFSVNQADHHKHMDYVQSVINRLANNSFFIKGWALTLTSALLGFAASRGEFALAIVAAIPAVAFWFLDTYYLRQERAFRAMYEDVADMKVTRFEIKPGTYAKQQDWNLAWSLSLAGFYGTLVVVSLLVAIGLAASSS